MFLLNVQINVVNMQQMPPLLQPPIERVRKRACQVSVNITRLDLNASCNANGPKLSLNPSSYFLVPIIIKCNKLMTMVA